MKKNNNMDIEKEKKEIPDDTQHKKLFKSCPELYGPLKKSVK